MKYLSLLLLLPLMGCSNLETLGVGENDNGIQCINASYTGTFTSSNGRFRRLNIPQDMELTAEQMIELLQQGRP